MGHIVPNALLAMAVTGLMLIAGGSASVVAERPAGDNAGLADGIDLGDHNIVIQDVTIHVADAHVAGPGLPDKSVDKARYTIDDTTVSTDGFTVTVTGNDISVGHVAVSLDNIGVTLENVSIGEASNR